MWWQVIAGAAAAATVAVVIPLGLDLNMPVPEINPLTDEKIALGRQLFFDPRLSRDQSISCSSCHRPDRAFSDGRAVAVGVLGRAGRRNAPALVNRGYGRLFFWDGRSSSLQPAKCMEKARKCPSARKMTPSSAQRTFPGGPMPDERTHNTGVAWKDGRLADEGAGHGAFKTPTLREVSHSAPYMHDGSLTTLEDVIDFYDHGGNANPYLDPEVRPVRFTPEEKRALIAFLEALVGTLQEGSPR